jgi:MFS family permease
VAPGLFIVFLAHILGGLSAGNVAIAIAYVADKSEAKGRRQAIGFVSAAMGLGTMVGPALGGALAPIGLGVPFLLAAGLSLVSIATTSAFLPADNRGSSGIRSDSRVVRKEKHPSNHARCSNQTLDDATPAAPFSLAKFLRGIADLVALPNAKALLTALAILYLAFSLFASQLALVLHARYQWDGEPFGPTEIGLLFTAAGATNILIQVVVVRAIRTTFHERTLVAVSFALLAGVFIAASGLALARPTLVAALTLIVPAGSQGVAMGLAQSLASLINIIGPIGGGLLIQRQNFIGWAMVLVALALTGFAAVGLLSIFPTKSNPTER